VTKKSVTGNSTFLLEDKEMRSSEVAHLREQVELEYEAMMRGLNSFAEGSAIHEFISARMARVEGYHHELAEEIGESEATQIICELYNKATG
jgi:hypothetical protein